MTAHYLIVLLIPVTALCIYYNMNVVVHTFLILFLVE